MFGMNDPNSLPMMRAKQMMAPGLIPGPVPTQQLTPGFRAPGGGSAPGLMQPQQTPGMDPMAMAMMARMMNQGSGANEQKVDDVLGNAPPGAQGDPMAQGAAQAADMTGGNPLAWLSKAFKGLF